jgi:ferredoxin--NADP+ reductase
MAAHHPLRVAVVGSGPAGIYTAEALVKRQPTAVQVDILDRLPTPYGLVRYGVAPDHPSIKSIARYLQRVLEHPAVRFLGGVELGRDVDREDLLSCYDAVVYATGAMVDRRLGIPGEDLPGSVAATDFVNWYCGHPDAAEYRFDLSVESAAVLGVGNVAVDVVRILARTAEELSPTDTPDPVLNALAGGKVRHIHMIGRRGPVHAKFTTKELRELGRLPEAEVWVDPADMELDPDAAALAESERRIRGNMAVLREWADRPASRGEGERRVDLRFWRRPVEIVGTDRVEALKLERTRLDDSGRVVGTGEYELLPVGMVLRSVGYQSVPLPGVPFDERSRTVPNEAGRISDGAGTARPREYVSGWLKRGPTGVIGTNKSDAAETVEALLADVSPAGLPGIDALLEARGVGVVSYDGWLAIDAEEMALARALGRGERVKLVGWDALRSAYRA